MSRLLVSQYQAKIEKLIQHGGSKHEASIRRAFENLLDEYCKTKHYELIAELEYKTRSGKTVKPDGTVKDAIRMAIGYWESKDQYDDLNEEIEKKFAKGYPNDNIIFEDSQTAVLYQNGEEVLRVSMQDNAALDRLLTQFINYDRPEVKDFRAAIAKFKEDVPDVLEALRSTIQAEEEHNEPFKQKRDQFWEICKESINPEITAFDIQEMLIQHILTEDIFLNIFGESQFHQENNIASELSAVVKTFFKGTIKRDTLDRTKHFYAVIQRTAASIVNHHEKQKFLKVIYENFYKAYNPKAADRLGIVYTPNEIVRFMIESADYLVHKHFGKLLADPGVEILDPATGTGTFITELIEYLPASKLEYKYKNEIHCNEVAILPYYVANLNIELTYKQKMGKYEEFKNICFVDTLDHTSFEGKQGDLFALSVENTERIKRQNDRTISIIIGNPPYNANQGNFNQRNANRTYPEIDKRIKNTYIKRGKAQNQNSVYDMYTRFYRWATDRLERGITVFITNSSFLDAHAFSGFRKCIQDEFTYAYIIDLGGNVRTISGRDGVFISEEHTIFGISAMTGIAIAFLVKDRNNNETCKLFYSNPFHVHELRNSKIDYLAGHKFQELSFEHINPDKGNNWINLTNNDFDDFLPLIDKNAKAKKEQETIFGLFSRGVATQRDEWVYSFSRKELTNKINYFVEGYQERFKNSLRRELDIKWDRELEKYLVRRISKTFEVEKIRRSAYRPFTQKYFYSDKHFNGMTYQMPSIFPNTNKAENLAIVCTDVGTQSPFMVTATDQIPDLHLVGTAAQCLPFYRYDKDGNRIENITDWALEEFRRRYFPSPSLPPSPAGEGGAREGKGGVGEGKVREGVEDGLVFLAGARRQIPEELLQRARELRKQQTSVEKILWECLRANRLCGAKFRRQHNIGQYIADFYCSAARLVIELDGEIHAVQQDRDGDRDTWMQSNGMTVLRFNNEAVIRNIEQTLQTIASYLPSPAGEGLGVRADSPAGEGLGVRADSPAGEGLGVRADSPAGEGLGVRADSPAGEGLGVRADSPAGEGLGVRADSPAEEGLGVRANSPAEEGLGVRADSPAGEAWTITKLDIFHYVYAVLHHPAYRTKYELNLKREFPRIPFYADFQQWADWGKQLMDLHINFEEVEPYELERIGAGMIDEAHVVMQTSLLESGQDAYPTKKAAPKCKLKVDKVAGTIELDTVTTLKGIPAIAWDYKLGNRSALEWILDQYKEKKPKDPTIAKLFNTYKFADYKEHVIDLLQRVCTVSVKTMAIVQQMPATVEHQGESLKREK